MSISLRVLAKNSVHCLEGVIRSVLPIVEEVVVVVDEESTDGTLALAQSIADVCVVHPFRGFGELRTFAAHQGSEKHEWVLMLDTDERLCPKDLPGVVGLTSNAVWLQYGVDAWALPRRQWDNLANRPNGPALAAVDKRVYPDFQVRLFKNKPEIIYVGAVHEQLIGTSKRGVVSPSDTRWSHVPHIHHYSHVFKTPQEIDNIRKWYDHLSNTV